MSKHLAADAALSDKELVEFINGISAELAMMASERGMSTLVPALRNLVASSRTMLGEIK
jgi:hypothetical protein